MNDIAKRPTLTHRGPPQGGRIANPLGFCREQTELQDTHTWSLSDVIMWKVWPDFLREDNKSLLRQYKDAWVIDHSQSIKTQAAIYHISRILLAGVCWIEVGGDPDWIDHAAYAIRKFEHTGPLPESWTVTKKPELTSLGDVSIQLRRAAEAAELDINQLNAYQRNELINCLNDEDVNIAFVAKHLYQLKKADKMCFTEDHEIKILGTRYNRGPDLSYEKILKNTSYGDFILRHRAHLESLLKMERVYFDD